MKLLTELQQLENAFRDSLKQVSTREQLESLRRQYLGRKGSITLLLRSLGELPAGQRRDIGQKANQLRQKIEEQLSAYGQELDARAKTLSWEREKIDVTLPGRPVALGQKHPITLIMDEIKEIFTCLGFQVARGPDVEYDYYNFEALNMPQDHPARDMQDSFYLTPEILLRTHTSPVQVRTMQAVKPQLPVRIIAPGRVYRRDDDATHSPMFHQVEGLAVDKRITFADLKGTLLLFAREMFGARQQIRLRPSFFPFTEPSAEVDISCIICGGSGCRTCSQSGWLEILGAGMVHPRVLEMSGYDPESVSGYAFGMGVERIAMLKYGLDDLRLLYANDLRLLSQF